MKKGIAAITMVREGGEYLRKWVDWYGAMLGKGNLYIFFDGSDQVPPDYTSGCNVSVVPRVEGKVAEGDRGRAALLSQRAGNLLDKYDFIIGTDVDEFITTDPASGLSLPEYLSALEPGERKGYSVLGCDVVENSACEASLDYSRPILSQRSYAFLSTRYSKASILCGKAQWGSGFHRIRTNGLHILPGVFLFHFGCADASAVLSKISDSDLQNRGWNHHLQKRLRLFDTVKNLPARDWDKWTPRARSIQSAIRPPWAWNKPSMAGIRIVVRIPERFSELF